MKARTSGQVRADSTSAPSTVLDYDLLYLSVPTSKTTVFLDGWVSTRPRPPSSGDGRELHGIQANPSFVDATINDLHLRSDSPGIDSGNNSAVGAPSTDADGVARPVNGGRRPRCLRVPLSSGSAPGTRRAGDRHGVVIAGSVVSGPVEGPSLSRTS